MKYYVETKFFNNGKTSGRMYLESEAVSLDKTPYTECKNYDRYVDEFASYEKAGKFLNDLKLA
jgi:hypothetical protein